MKPPPSGPAASLGDRWQSDLAQHMHNIGAQKGPFLLTAACFQEAPRSTILPCQSHID